MISILEANGKYENVMLKGTRCRIILRTMDRALETQWLPSFGIKYCCGVGTNTIDTLSVKTRSLILKVMGTHHSYFYLLEMQAQQANSSELRYLLPLK